MMNKSQLRRLTRFTFSSKIISLCYIEDYIDQLLEKVSNNTITPYLELMSSSGVIW